MPGGGLGWDLGPRAGLAAALRWASCWLVKDSTHIAVRTADIGPRERSGAVVSVLGSKPKGPRIETALR